MVKLLELTPKVYRQYRTEVKGNENDSFDLVRRKMTRNMRLAAKAPEIENKPTLYMYGSLHFLVTNNQVVWIANKRKKPQGWSVDKNEYVRLNKELRIDGKSKADLHRENVKYFFKRNKSKLQHKFKLALNK